MKFVCFTASLVWSAVVLLDNKQRHFAKAISIEQIDGGDMLMNSFFED